MPGVWSLARYHNKLLVFPLATVITTKASGNEHRFDSAINHYLRLDCSNNLFIYSDLKLFITLASNHYLLFLLLTRLQINTKTSRIRRREVYRDRHIEITNTRRSISWWTHLSVVCAISQMRNIKNKMTKSLSWSTHQDHEYEETHIMITIKEEEHAISKKISTARKASLFDTMNLASMAHGILASSRFKRRGACNKQNNQHCTKSFSFWYYEFGVL